MLKETFSTKFSIFTRTKLLMIHRFIEKHNFPNLQPCPRSISGNSIGALSHSDRFNRLKLLRIEIQPFHGQTIFWNEVFP